MRTGREDKPQGRRVDEQLAFAFSNGADVLHADAWEHRTRIEMLEVRTIFSDDFCCTYVDPESYQFLRAENESAEDFQENLGLDQWTFGRTRAWLDNGV